MPNPPESAPRRVESSILTVLMAAVFALSLVPTGAFAAPDTTKTGSDSGVLGTKEGSITIKGTREGETYDVYRIFDLASFADEDPAAGQHASGTEAYSYVIRETIPNPNFDNDQQESESNQKYIANPWYTFLTTQPTGGNAYAAPIPDTGVPADDAEYWGNSETPAHTNQLFWIEPAKVTAKGPNGTETVTDYHVVTATKNFPNTWDVAETYAALNNPDTSTTPETDDPDPAHGTFPHAGTDYVEPNPDNDTATSEDSIRVVQQFAQAALAYARGTGADTDKDGLPDAQTITPNYVETGVASNVNGGDVAVDGTDTKNNDGAFDKTAKDSEVPLGWYLVGTTTGTLAALDTANSTVDVYEKNEVPTIEKRVLKRGGTVQALAASPTDPQRLSFGEWLVGRCDSTTSAYDPDPTNGNADKIDWVRGTEADLEDLVMFRTVVDAKQGELGYKIHDVMERGLEYLDDAKAAAATSDATNEYGDDAIKTTGNTYDYTTKLYLVRKGTTTEMVEGQQVPKDTYTAYQIPKEANGKTNWTLTTATDDQCDFEVAIFDSTDDSWSATEALYKETLDDGAGHVLDVKDSDYIVVTYWARLKKDEAAVFPNGETDQASSSQSSVKYNNGEAIEDIVQEENKAQRKSESDGDKVNDNHTILTYGNKSRTEWSKASVFTFEFDVVKAEQGTPIGAGDEEFMGFDEGTGVNYPLLAGAKFRAYKATVNANERITTENDIDAAITDDGYTVSVDPDPTDSTDSPADTTFYQASKALRFAKTDPAVYTYLGDKATDTATDGTVEIVSIDTKRGSAGINTAIELRGLEPGYYILVEETAPTGYNKLAYPIVVRVYGDRNQDGQTSDKPHPSDIDITAKDNNNKATTVRRESIGTVSAGTSTYEYGKFKDDLTTDDDQPAPEAGQLANGGVLVVNQTGQELPSTGGIGTTIFYVAGTVLVVGAAVMLVAKRRMGAEA